VVREGGVQASLEGGSINSNEDVGTVTAVGLGGEGWDSVQGEGCASELEGHVAGSPSSNGYPNLQEPPLKVRCCLPWLQGVFVVGVVQLPFCVAGRAVPEPPFVACLARPN